MISPPPVTPADHRTPYVGEGIDGCLRSAEIDRTEADTYRTGGPNWQRCMHSALRWEAQAQALTDHPESPAAKELQP